MWRPTPPGNVLGILSARKLPPESTGPLVLLSAHLDTVFPAGTPLHPLIEGERLQAPGACDNGAGVAGMLAVIHSLLHAGVELPAPLALLGNVGEEGEGDLRGVRHFYEHSALAGRVAAHIVLDGAGTDAAVHKPWAAGATGSPLPDLAGTVSLTRARPIPSQRSPRRWPGWRKRLCLRDPAPR